MIRACSVLILASVTSSLGGTEFVVADAAQFSRAATQLSAGDTIVMRNRKWTDVDLVLDARGTRDAPIKLRAQEPGQVVITGASRLRINGSHVVVEGLQFRNAWHEDALIAFRRDSKQSAEDCRLTNCAFIDCNPADGKRESKYVSLYGRRNRVDHCYLAGKENPGATLVVWLDGNPASHRIDHNYFGPRPPLGKNGGETIRVGDSKTSLSSAKVMVESNLFEHCDGEAEIISNKSCENAYRYNTFRACSGALTLRHGHRCLVEANFFLGEKARGTGGVRIIGEDHRVVNNYFERLEGDDSRSALSLMNGLADSPLEGYSPVKRAIVAFNTIVDCKRSLVLGLSDEDAGNDQPPEDCVFANNLVHGRRGPLIEVRTIPLRTKWLGNIMGGAEVGIEVPGILFAENLTFDARDGFLRPRPEGLVHDAAVGDWNLPRTDIEGQPRDAKKDIGCDERSEAAVTVRPLTARDVGTTWAIHAE